MFCSEELLGSEISSAAPDDIEKEKERFHAMCFLLRSDKNRYEELLEDSKQGVFRGCDEYPRTVPEAYKLLIRSSRYLGFHQRRNISWSNLKTRQEGDRSNNFVFAQQDGMRLTKNTNNINPSTHVCRDGVTHENITCFVCIAMGNDAKSSPYQDRH